MKFSAIITVLLVVLGLGVAIYAFLQNSSPYVTIAEAKERTGQTVHVAAELVPNSVVSDPDRKLVTFTIREDKTGQELPVVYHGFKPENMERAPRIVIAGEMRGGTFECSQILLKCPSKYQGKQK
jgi:cytochrome c-type biogenesis protein CcmE